MHRRGRWIPLAMIAAATCIAPNAFTQAVELDWARAFGGAGFDEIDAVAADSQGSIYIGGNTRPDDNPPEGDLAVAKYTAAGEHEWTYAPDESGNGIVNGLAVDAEGYVYAVGTYTESSDLFVLKLNTHGEFEWQAPLAADLTGVDSGSTGRDIAVDAAGNVYATGSFSGSLDTQPNNAKTLLTSTGAFDAFVVKFTSDGLFVWAQQIGGLETQFATGIAIDDVGDTVVTGFFTGTTQFPNGATRTAVGGLDTWVCSLHRDDGSTLWATAFGGPADDAANDIAIDGLGRLRLCGVFAGEADFDPGQGVDEAALSTSTNETDDMFLLTLSPLGGYLRHSTFGSAGADLLNGLAVDGMNNVYVGGNFTDTVDFQNGSGIATLTATTAVDQCLVKLDANDDFVWGVGLVAPSFSALSSVAVSTAGGVAVAGIFTGDLDADTSTGSASDATSAGSVDGYVAHFNQDGTNATFADPQLEAAVRDALLIPEGPIPVESLATLTDLVAAGRGIQMLDGLQLATGLQSADLSYNAIEDIGALVNNGGIGTGDFIALFGNPLSQDAICNDIPALEARGVTVGFDGACGVANTVRVQGFVMDGATPLTSAALLLTQDGTVAGTAVVDDGGYYEVNGLTEGATYTFEFFALGYIPQTVQRTLGSGIEEISVDLDPSFNPALTGSVIDDAENPNAIAGALITVSQNGAAIARTVAYANGQFEFHTLPGALKFDPVTVDITAPSYVGDSIVVDPDEAEPVGAVLEKINLPGSLVGTVVDAQGLAVVDAQVVIQQTPAGFSAARQSTGDGAYSVASVPDGTYEVRAVVKDVGWGMNNGEVQQSLATIDVELLRDLRDCIAPATPTGLVATDGTDFAGVSVSWNAVAGGGIEYRVYRGIGATFGNASPVSDWLSATSHLDTTAAAPTPASGCNGGSTEIYHYWVLARTTSNECESEPSSSDTGFRGAAKTMVEAAGTADAIDLVAFAVTAILVASRVRSRYREAR